MDGPMKTVIVNHPGGPHITVFVQCVVSEKDPGNDGDMGQVRASGYATIDLQMSTLLRPEEFAVRHLWPAFLAATQHAHVELPAAYQRPPSKPLLS